MKTVMLVSRIRKRIPKTEKIVISYTWGAVKVEGTWVPIKAERQACWDLYVELITRISVIKLPSDEGILRESLTSLHTVFTKTRDILHNYGPEISRTSDDDTMSFGYLAIVILNYVLRPFLTKWHPKLQDWEDTRRNDVSRVEHERQWESNEALRGELNEIRSILIEYVTELAKVAKVPLLIIQPLPISDTIPNTTLENENLTFYGVKRK